MCGDGSRSTPIDGALTCECDEVAADAAAEVGEYGSGRSTGSARLAAGEACGFVGGDPFVGGLFEADAGEEHSVGVGELCRRAAAQLDLLEQQMRLGRGEIAAQAGDGGVKRCCRPPIRRDRRLRRR